MYVALGIDMDGHRDVLGRWGGPTGGEGAKQWMNMLAGVGNRGILDELIVCCDGLKSLPDASTATWPLSTVQTWAVHLVGNGLRYAAKQHWQTIARQLRGSYTAPTTQIAQDEFEDFAAQWEPQYPPWSRCGGGPGRSSACSWTSRQRSPSSCRRSA